MKKIILIVALLFGSFAANSAEQDGISVGFTGKTAQKLFAAGDIEPALFRAEYSFGYEEFEVSNFGSFHCYKLVKVSFGASFMNSMRKSVTPNYQCQGVIYK